MVSALFQKVLLSERLDASSELFGMVLAEAAAPEKPVDDEALPATPGRFPAYVRYYNIDISYIK